LTRPLLVADGGTQSEWRIVRQGDEGSWADAFLNLVRRIESKRVLLVRIDMAKATWFVVASNLLSEVVAAARGWSPTKLSWPSSSACSGRATGSMRRWSWSGPKQLANATRRSPATCLTVTNSWCAYQLRRRCRSPCPAGQRSAQDRLAGRGGHLRAAGPRRGRVGAPRTPGQPTGPHQLDQQPGLWKPPWRFAGWPDDSAFGWDVRSSLGSA
jgi:hypothetical protein